MEKSLVVSVPLGGRGDVVLGLSGTLPKIGRVPSAREFIAWIREDMGLLSR